jgi:hypothetical protein
LKLRRIYAFSKSDQEKMLSELWRKPCGRRAWQLNANVTRVPWATETHSGKFLIEDLQGGAEHVDFLVITTGNIAIPDQPGTDTLLQKISATPSLLLVRL